MQKELVDLFSRYWRDLQQSQPNGSNCSRKRILSRHCSVRCRQVHIPTSGRGYVVATAKGNGGPLSTERQGEKLVVIVVSDFYSKGRTFPTPSASVCVTTSISPKINS